MDNPTDVSLATAVTALFVAMQCAEALKEGGPLSAERAENMARALSSFASEVDEVSDAAGQLPLELATTIHAVARRLQGL